MSSQTTDTETGRGSAPQKDEIRESFLQAQMRAALALSAASDIVRVHTVPNQFAPERYVAQFSCKTLVRASDGNIVETDFAAIGIWFHEGHLRHVEPLRVVRILEPRNLWHPNARFPLLCAGHITCATTLHELVYHVWEVLTYRKWASHDGLNEAACQWARQNQDRFPTDPRPLLRNAANFEVEMVSADSEN